MDDNSKLIQHFKSIKIDATTKNPPVSNDKLIDIVQINSVSKDQKLFHEMPDTSKIDLLIFKSMPSIGARKTAEIKIYEVLLLNAWRKRRNDAVRLRQQLTSTEKLVSKLKTQCTILQKLLSAEQKLNESHVEKINDMTNGIDNLSKALEAESNDKINVQTALMEKENENVFLREKLENAEKEFFSLTQYMAVLNQKLLEVETFQADLSNEKEQLINENEQLKNELIRRTQGFSFIVMFCDNLMQRKQDESEILLRDIDTLKFEALKFVDLVQENDNQKEIIEALQNEIMQLKYQIESSMIRRFKKLSIHGIVLMFEICRQFTNYLLPAFPVACNETPTNMLNSSKKAVQPVISVKTIAY